MSDTASLKMSPPLLKRKLEYSISMLNYDEKNAKWVKGKSLNAQSIQKGEEALSALYRYVLRLGSPGTAESTKMADWLGKRVVMEVSLETDTEQQKTIIQTVYGIISSVVSCPVELYGNHRTGWFELTVQPEFVRACYSRNRAVYSPEKETKNPEDVLRQLAAAWNTACTVSADAVKRIPHYLQVIQNDESDYNFFCRLLSTWGLGYYWVMNAGTQKEELCVYDALGGEIISPKEVVKCMSKRSDALPAWSRHCGFHNVASGEMGVQNYAGSFSSANSKANRLKLSLHDESWDQLSQAADGDSRFSTLHYLNRCYNAVSVHGIYCYSCEHSEETGTALKNVADITFGRRVSWASCAAYDKTEYFVTKREISADFYGWSVEFTGRSAVKVGENTVGLGVMPVPMELRPDAETGEGLFPVPAAAWDTPRARTFMAVVVSDEPLMYQGRNFCQVRELNGEEMWVEMGSPYADSRSGFFARPRVDNVLFCLDRGDLSIPLVLTSFFRSRETQESMLIGQGVTEDIYQNEAPHTQLKTMNRRKSEWNEELTPDSSALTLRNRTHVPAREYEKQGRQEAKDSAIPSVDLEFVQRPQCVHDLAEHPKPFSQIQMVARDNGVKPIPHDDAYANTYLASSVVETAAGLAADSNSPTYAMAASAKSFQDVATRNITRPHLQGINMYSAQDVLVQSADHQVYNAGGVIELTANHAIRLKVGTSSVTIRESGVEIKCGTGKVYHPGAFPVFHSEKEAESSHLIGNTIPLSGSIVVDSAGVKTTGPYLTNTATNMFSVSTLLGSSFKLSDFSASLNAPATSIVGGAGAFDTVNSIANKLPALVNDFVVVGTPAGDGSDGVYKGYLEDGWNKVKYTLAGINGTIAGVVQNVSLWGSGLMKIADRAAAFSVTGSMLDLKPSQMTLAAEKEANYFAELKEYDSPLAGFKAFDKRLPKKSGNKVIDVLNPVFSQANRVASWEKLGFSMGSRAGAANKSFYKKFPKDDAFTVEFPTAQPKEETSVTSDGVIAGSVILAATTSVLGYLSGKAVTWVFDHLFLARESKRLGLKDTEQLGEIGTRTEKLENTLDKNENSLQESDHSVSANNSMLIEEENKVSEEKKVVNRNAQMLNCSNISTKITEVSGTASRTVATEQGSAAMKQTTNMIEVKG